MGDEGNKNEKYAQQFRSLEKRVSLHDEEVKTIHSELNAIRIDLAGNTFMTKHLDETLCSVKDTMKAMHQATNESQSKNNEVLNKISNKLDLMDHKAANVVDRVDKLEEQAKEDKIKRNINTLDILKSIVLRYVLPTGIAGGIIAGILAIAGVI